MNGWIDATQSLPAEREYVRFVVVGHRRSLTGVYENHSFCSRWGSYDPTTVSMWRKLGDAPRSARRQRMLKETRRGGARENRGRSAILRTADGAPCSPADIAP